MSGSEKKVEVPVSGLTPRMYVLMIIIILATLAVESAAYISPHLAWRHVWFPLPLIFFMFIDFVLGKISPKLKLTTPEWVVLFTTAGLITFSTYIEQTAPYIFMLPILAQGPFMALYFKMHPSFARYGLGDLIPNIMAPADPSAIDAFTYGGPLNWGAWLPFCLFWSFQWLTLVFIYAFWGYIMRKPLVEVERLPFPHVVAATELIRLYTTETGGKPMLFNFKEIKGRLFWIGFLIASIFLFPKFILSILPIGWGAVPYSYSFDLADYVRSFLPGSYTRGTLDLAMMSWMIFTNLDVLISAVIFFVLFSIIYPAIGVTMGFLPYKVGYEGSQWYYGVSYGPFQWVEWMWYLPFGIGLWFLINNWEHVKRILLSIRETKPPEEEGVSYKLVAYGAILSFLAFWALWIIVGAPAIASFLMVIFLIIVLMGYTVAAAEGGLVPWNNYFRMGIHWDFGAITGGWSWAKPDPRSLTYSIMYMASLNDGHRMSGFVIHNSLHFYKTAYELKTRAKDVLYTILIVGIIVSFLVHFYGVWLYTSFGGWSGPLGTDTIGYAAWYAWVPLADAKTGGYTEAAFDAYGWELFISGILVTLGMYWLRAKFTWFILNPIGFFGAYGYYFWANALVVAIFKYIVLKVGGADVYSKYVVPGAVGFTIAVGFWTTLTWFVVFWQGVFA